MSRASMTRLRKNIRWFIDNAGNSELKAMGARGRENLEKNLTRNVSVKKYAEEILKLQRRREV